LIAGGSAAASVVQKSAHSTPIAAVGSLFTSLSDCFAGGRFPGPFDPAGSARLICLKIYN
jgi:hypothetical protein